MATPMASLAGMRAARPGMKFCGATNSTKVNPMRPQNGTDRSSRRAGARSSDVSGALATSSNAISCAMRASSRVDLVHIGRDDEVAKLIRIAGAARLRRLDDVVELPRRDIVQTEARTIPEAGFQVRVHPLGAVTRHLHHDPVRPSL